MTESKNEIKVPAKMAAVRVHKYGGPEALQHDEVDVPKVGANEVLVQIAYSGINFIDTYLRTGLYPTSLPGVLGREGSGIVAAVGSDVKSVQVGARVAFCEPGSGVYAEYAAINAGRVVAVPKGTSLRDAAAVMLQGITAQYLACSTHKLKKGDVALVHAGAGGTGGLLIQYAKRAGATVITTVSTEEKAKQAAELGADHVIIYTKQDFLEEVTKITDKKLCNAVYDGVGATTWEKSLKCTAPLGTLVFFGNASGPVPAVDPLLLSKQGSIFMTRPAMGHYIASNDVLAERAKDVLDFVASGKFKLRVSKEFPLKEASEAHKFLESRKSDGKILLVVNAKLDA